MGLETIVKYNLWKGLLECVKKLCDKNFLLTEDVSFGTSSLLAHKHVFLQATINMKPNIQNFLPSQKCLFKIKISPKILFLAFYKSVIALQVLFCLVLLSVQQHRKDQFLNKKCVCNFFWERPHLLLWNHIFSRSPKLSLSQKIHSSEDNLIKLYLSLWAGCHSKAFVLIPHIWLSWHLSTAPCSTPWCGACWVTGTSAFLSNYMWI